MQVADLFARLRLAPDKGSFKAADKLLGAVKTALAGIVAYRTAGFFKGLVEDTVALGGKLNDLSQAAGVPAKTLQELGYAAQQNGSSLEELAGGMNKLSKNAYEAANGGKTQAEAFRKLGVSVKDSRGKLRPAESILGDIADRFATMPDGAEKTAQAISVLGRSGASLIPTLNAGSKGLAESAARARDLGGVIDDETVKSLDDLGDQTDDIKLGLTGLRNDAVKALLPTLKEMASSFLAWVKVNRKVITQKLAAAFRGIVFALKMLAKGVGVVVDVLTVLGKNIEFVTAFVIGLGAAMLILKAKSVAAALASAAAWVVATLPLLLLAALIAAVILIIQDIWVAFNGGDSVLKDLYNSFVTWLGETGVGKVLGGVLAGITAIIDKAKEAANWLGNLGRKAGGKAFELFASDERKANALAEASALAAAAEQARASQTRIAAAEAAGFTGIGAVARHRESLNAPTIGPAAPGTPMLGAPMLGPAAPGGGTVVNANLTVNANGTDPAGVTRSITENMHNMLRDAMAGAI